jgi:hypothetical protein
MRRHTPPPCSRVRPILPGWSSRKRLVRAARVAKVLLAGDLAPSRILRLSRRKFRKQGPSMREAGDPVVLLWCLPPPVAPGREAPGGRAVLPREPSTVSSNGQADAPRRATSHVEESACSLRHWCRSGRTGVTDNPSTLLSRKSRCSAPVRRAGGRTPRLVRAHRRSPWCTRSRSRAARGRRSVLDLDCTTRSRLPVRLRGRRTWSRSQHSSPPAALAEPEVPTLPAVGFRDGTGFASPAEPRWLLVRHTRSFSEFRVRSPECTGVWHWESMTPRDHPAEEREAGTLAPALRSAATVRHS